MLKRLFLVILLAVVAAGCARNAALRQHGAQPIALAKSPQTRTVSSFNRVTVTGTVNVNLHTGYSKPQVILSGDPRALAQTTTVVQNNTLIIQVPNNQFGSVNADIRGRFLNGFTYTGSGRITGQHLRSGLLDLIITNSGRTTLAGDINLRRLEVNGEGYVEIKGVKAQNLQLAMTGNPKVQLVGVVGLSDLIIDGDGSFSMYWIKSNRLVIRARGHSFLQLGGIVDKLDVELWDSSRFNGRYLRARRSFVKTHGRSVAEITAIEKQHTLAMDASDIYFFKIPDMKMDFMANNGSVLDMRDWNIDDLRDYDRYNKQTY
ncbi:GIN domain-containing protein [Legionella dresdenensis]|uniref:GIN domain-containing protein n=1 Tax=Legionella dresdenensis TaxID=450200 RepID=A0ABV8CI51_9GAMM